jgi:hypothetical protein
LFVAALLYRSPFTMGIVALVSALYTFMAMKRVYRQSYVMTFLKWASLGVVYFMFVVGGMVFALIWAFAAVSPV